MNNELLKEKSLALHKMHQGKIEVMSKTNLRTPEDLSLVYTPGVAFVCQEIAKNKEKVYEYTAKGRMVAVITDGSAVLGLGNIGAEASLPVMEGKAQLFKKFGGVDAFPIAVKTQDPEEFISIVKNISPIFGGINLEDISAPRCFLIERRLIEELDIPVFHDDQHGTAIVVLAGLINAAKLAGKNLKDLEIVISGAGAAGISVARILLHLGLNDIILVDSLGIIYSGRAEGMNEVKTELAKLTNKEARRGGLKEAVDGADAFVGVSKPGILSEEMIKTMTRDPIIFAMANPVPEIMPEEARKAGVKIIATGRSDYPNQINNCLAFPGVFRGVLNGRIKKITMEMKVAAAESLANYIKEPEYDYFIPRVFDEGMAEVVAEAIMAVK